MKSDNEASDGIWPEGFDHCLGGWVFSAFCLLLAAALWLHLWGTQFFILFYSMHGHTFLAYDIIGQKCVAATRVKSKQKILSHKSGCLIAANSEQETGKTHSPR